MKTEHTPGPWKVREDYAGAQSVVSADAFLARVGPPNTEQAEANARLIAAAPELLEALQGLLAAVEQGTLPGSGKAQDAARAAIAKATGSAA